MSRTETDLPIRSYLAEKKVAIVLSATIPLTEHALIKNVQVIGVRRKKHRVAVDK